MRGASRVMVLLAIAAGGAVACSAFSSTDPEEAGPTPNADGGADAAMSSEGGAGSDAEGGSDAGDEDAPVVKNDAGTPTTDAGEDATVHGPHHVFVTAATWSGDVVAASATLECQSEAAGASLTGDYAAVFATSTVSPLGLVGDSQQIVTVSGIVVAQNWTLFIGGKSSAPVGTTANGQFVAASELVWTGLADNGTAGDTCGDWAAQSGAGSYGIGTAAGSTAISAGSTACIEKHAVYCIEQ